MITTRSRLLLVDHLARSPLVMLDEAYRPPISQRSPLKMLRRTQTHAVRTHKTLGPSIQPPKAKEAYPWEKHHPPGSETEAGRVVTPGALKIVKDIEASMPQPRPPKPQDPHQAAQKAVAKTMRPVHDEIAKRKRTAEMAKRRQEADRAREQRRQEGLRRKREGAMRHQRQHAKAMFSLG